MTPERELLRDAVASLLRDHCTTEHVAAADGDWAPELWKQLDTAGLTTIGVPEDEGGSGGDVADAALVVRAAAAAAAPVPLAETLLIAPFTRAAAGLPQRSGTATVLVLDVGGAQADAHGWSLNGSAQRVPWGRRAGSLVLVTTDDAGTVLVADVDPSDVEVTTGVNLAGEPSDMVTVRGLRLPEDRIGRGPDDLIEAVLSTGSLSRTVMIAGALETVLGLTIEYARERIQFGRPIAKFQAVKQQIAELAGEVAVAGAAADGAVTSVQRGDAAFAVAAARVRAAQAATTGAQIAHQIHGAMGFTREHQLQLFTRRLWAWRDEYGTEGYWRRSLGRRIAAAGGDDLWQSLVS